MLRRNLGRSFVRNTKVATIPAKAEPNVRLWIARKKKQVRALNARHADYKTFENQRGKHSPSSADALDFGTGEVGTLYTDDTAKFGQRCTGDLKG